MSIPPTPTSIRSSSTRSSLYDRYASPPVTAIPRHHYYSPPPPELDQHELARIRSCLAQKEAENATMKQALSEWQAKVQSYRETQEQLQGQIRCLNAEMEAMKKAHVQRVDDDAQLILELSKEIEQLKAATTTLGRPENTATVDPCVTAEETYKKAASQVLYGRKKADALILGINDMVRAIEEELACFETAQDDDDDDSSSDAMSSIPSPDTWEQPQQTMDYVSDTAQKRITPLDDSKEISSSAPLESSSTTTAMVTENGSPSTSHHHHHQQQQQQQQQQQRSFRPRSQTMDTLVKKASMFLLRPNKRSPSTSEQPQQHDASSQPRPTPSCTSPHPGSSNRTSSTGPVVSPLQQQQQHRNQPLLSSRSSSIQNLNNIATTTTSTPLVNHHKDKRRQSMIFLPSSASQFHQFSSDVDNPTLGQSSSSSSRSRLMYHYQQQQHAVKEYYQRRRRSAIVGGATPPFVGASGDGELLKPTVSEQWKISSSRR